MVSNYDQFMAALRAERQRELRQTAAGGMQQRHLPSPDTRLGDPTREAYTRRPLP